MDVTIYVFSYMAIIVLLYFKTSLFISQYYDAKRMLILEKQKYQEWNKEIINIIPFGLLLVSIGFIWYSPIIANTLLFVALLIEIINSKKILFKCTRRSITLLLFSSLLPLICLFNINIISYCLVSVVILFNSFITILANYILLPIEMLIRYHYIKQAKNKIKKASNLKIIAITGSYGKTSFKNYLYTLLYGKYNVLKTPGSVNTPLGICKFINNNLTPYEDILIVELGVDAPNTMKKFFKMFTPTIGVVTAIGEMHLATFKTIANIQKEKLSLFDKVSDKKGIFYNNDSPYMDLKSEHKKNATSYSIEDVNNVVITIEGTYFTYKGIKCFVNLLGKHQLTNLIGAIKVAEYLKLPMEYIIKRLALIKAEPHRMSVTKGTTTIIDDSYNANFVGLSEAINVINTFKGKKGIILNGIIEAGESSDKQNYEIGKLLTHFNEIVILSSTNEKLMEALDKAKKRYKKFDEYRDGISYLKKKKLDYILLCSRAEKDFIK